MRCFMYMITLVLLSFSFLAGCSSGNDGSGGDIDTRGNIDWGDTPGDENLDGDEDLDTYENLWESDNDSSEIVLNGESIEDLGCRRLDQGAGTWPSIHTFHGRWYVFYAVDQYGTYQLFVRLRSLNDPNWGGGAGVVAGARQADLEEEGERIKALIWRQFYAVEFYSEANAAEWTESKRVVTRSETYNCEGYRPAMYFRGPQAAHLVAAGAEYHDGIIGCQSEVYVSEWDGTEWQSEVIGKGTIAGAFAIDGAQTIVSDYGIYNKKDNESEFVLLDDGDTTADQLKATGAALSGTHIIAVQSYEWDSTQHLALISSPDGGRQWPDRLVLQTATTPFFSAMIAADQDNIVVAWKPGNADSVQAMASSDGGYSWSETLSFSHPDGGGNINNLSLAVTGKKMAVVFGTYHAEAENNADKYQVIFCEGRLP